jgi:hypothetical protein
LLKILLPNNNEAERDYTVHILLAEFTGLQFDIEHGPTRFAAEITLENGCKLRFEDHFFQLHTAPLSYLSQENVPKSVTFISREENPYILEPDLPVIFGRHRLQVRDDEIICGIDIFASTFFMLTRWEEYVKQERDPHNRFPATASLSFQHNFLHRPIVDEYVEMLWNMLKYLGITQYRKERKFRAMITHDVDFPLQWRSPFSLVKKLSGDLLKRKSPAAACRSLSNFIKTKAGREKDPFDSFDYLMDLSEKHGHISHFYFLCGGNTTYDKGHLSPGHPFMKKLMKRIDERGHIIGFHPSYNTYNNPPLFKQELELLQRYSPQEIKSGRQHFLRFEVPTTWLIWEANGLDQDSSLYYAEAAGFRCGTCQEFQVFDFLERKELKLREVPLTAMEVTWTDRLRSSPKETYEDILYLLDTVQKRNGNFVFLWHNSSFSAIRWEGYCWVFEKLLAISQYN